MRPVVRHLKMAMFPLLFWSAPAAALDECLIGRWVPEMEAMQANLTAISGLPTQVSGDIEMIVTADGMAQVTMRDFKLEVRQAPGAVLNRANGTASLELATEGSNIVGTITTLGIDMAVFLTMPEMPPQPLTTRMIDLADMPNPNFRTAYTCAGDLVTIEGAPDRPVPARVWVRG